jgi:hypothetical protein
LLQKRVDPGVGRCTKRTAGCVGFNVAGADILIAGNLSRQRWIAKYHQRTGLLLPQALFAVTDKVTAPNEPGKSMDAELRLLGPFTDAPPVAAQV